jgi:putative transposase
MRRTYKFRLFPNVSQKRELDIMLESHRRLYNTCLAQRKESWEESGKAVRYSQQSAWFKAQRETNKWFAHLNFSSAQATLRRLDKSFQNFFRRVKAGQKPGYPRFKAAGCFHSVEFPAYGDGIRLNEKLRIQHVGFIRCKAHREVEGVVKTASLKKEAGKWFLLLSCILPDADPQITSKASVGIDVGLEHFLTTSDGEHVPNPHYLKNQLPKLRRTQRAVSRAKRGSTNRARKVEALQKVHTKITNCRKDHQHKVALELVRRYGTIAVERLNITGMLKTRWLARAISDAAWGGFLETLRHKAESAGVLFVEVDCRGTSQECSQCGEVVSKKLSTREHNCPHCGLVLQRDVNAARNILARASGAWTGPVGANHHPVVS